MSKFVNELKYNIHNVNWGMGDVLYKAQDDLEELVYNIHPNTLRHIKIAELENELIDVMGFERVTYEHETDYGVFDYYALETNINYKYDNDSAEEIIDGKFVIDITNKDTVELAHYTRNHFYDPIHYDCIKTWDTSSPTLHDDVITYVKQLMEQNDES